MRISVSHNKTKQEAMRTVNEATDQVLRPGATGFLQITDVQKTWAASTMTFSVTASFAVMRSVIRGTIEVTDRDVIIDCDLPQLLTRFMGEDKIRSGIEGKIRGLLK